MVAAGFLGMFVRHGPGAAPAPRPGRAALRSRAGTGGRGAPRPPSDEALRTMILPLVLKLLNEPLLSANLPAAHMPCEPGLSHCRRWDRNTPSCPERGER
ncbi:hypothetical protein ANANG_G00087730 [Anguilla anguilla]|uniref:Uncharacterized protein n=1 Tax=Anguilla anguilla TaxID=7936 RepID=A0A9D3MNB1_ANGAN|nr:hypothetical protein ANANG_G00087730 [Anguilla anguilla]